MRFVHHLWIPTVFLALGCTAEITDTAAGGDSDASSDAANPTGQAPGTNQETTSPPGGTENDGAVSPIGGDGSDDGGSGGAQGMSPVGNGDGDGDSTMDPPGPTSTAACSDEPPGTEEGDYIEDFTLVDQHGNMVTLSDYCGQTIYIPLGAMWCPGCRSHAEGINEMLATYGDQGFTVLNLMAETTQGKTPTPAELTTWADTYSLTIPVLADADWQIWERYWPEHSTPKALLIDKQGKLAVIGYVGGWNIDKGL